MSTIQLGSFRRLLGHAAVLGLCLALPALAGATSQAQERIQRLAASLGLDRLTVKLLGQRLEEDLALMRAMRRVEVV